MELLTNSFYSLSLYTEPMEIVVDLNDDCSIDNIVEETWNNMVTNVTHSENGDIHIIITEKKK